MQGDMDNVALNTAAMCSIKYRLMCCRISAKARLLLVGLLLLLLLVSAFLVNIKFIKPFTRNPSFKQSPSFKPSSSFKESPPFKESSSVKQRSGVSKSSDSVARVKPVRKVQTFNHRLTESELLYLNPVTVDTSLLKNVYLRKIEDMKKNNVLKSFDKREQCVKNKKIQGIVCEDRACTSSLPPIESDANFLSFSKPLSRVRVEMGGLLDSVRPITTFSQLTFVTAASSNHYLESQALIKNLQLTVFPNLKNFTFYYYDLGLSQNQRQQLETHCRCEVRSYPFHLLPTRLRSLQGYTWKPIIIQAHLPHTEILVWMDSSVRFKTGNLKPMFDRVKQTGILVTNDGFGVAEHTLKTTFDYFGDKPCAYSIYNECEANFVVMLNDVFMREVFVKTWCACAIDPECMSRERDKRYLHCNTDIWKYNKCHRFDQSALSILLAKLFRENTASFYVQRVYHDVNREEIVKYFEQLETKNT